MTYEQWRQQAAKRGDLNTESAWNAAIAARDEELRKQEPKAVWLQMSNETGFPSRVNSEAHLCAIKHPDFTVENLYLTPKPPHDEASLKALYAAPIPPTVPDTNLETATNRNYLESIGQLPPTEGSKP